MNHSLGILSSGVKLALHFEHFMTNFGSQNCSVIFHLNEDSKKPCPRFLIAFFTFWDIGQYYIFVFFEIGNKNRKYFMTQEPHIFWGIVGTVLLSGYFPKCTPLLKELRKRFLELELEHCTLTQNPLRTLIPFHRY